MSEMFTQFTLTDFVENLEKMTPEARREGLIAMLNKCAMAAGVNTMSMLWAVITASGGSVLVPHSVLETYDPNRIHFAKKETEEGILYTASLVEGE